MKIRTRITAAVFPAAVVLALFSMMSPLVMAYDLPAPITKVTLVETLYVPNAIFFLIDQPVADCVAGDWITWDGGATFAPGSLATDADRKAKRLRSALTRQHLTA